LSNGSLISKFIPFFNPSTDFDPALETQLNTKLDGLVNGKQKPSYSSLLMEGVQIPILPGKSISEYEYTDFSKTNVPADIDIGIIMAPLEGKDQDHADFRVMSNGGLILVVCDGVSEDGPESKVIAEAIPNYMFDYIEDHFPLRLDAARWENLIQTAIDDFTQNYHQPSGASTLLISYLNPDRSDLFIAWLGDGNILCFNKELSGYGKLLIPHQSPAGKLSGVITSQGQIGKLSTNHLRVDGGTLIMSSDGFNLTNGRLLKHFYQVVLKGEDIHEKLSEWTYGRCCEDLSYHPEPMDDRSMIVVRW
jgi:hypothetical protein